MLIAFCGIDGAGKTTQIEKTKMWLEERQLAVTVTRQPTDWYRDEPFVRNYLDTGEGRGQGRIEAELALFSACDRMRNLRIEIEPALARGDIVLSDRYVYSSFAYFECRVDAEFRRWVESLNSFVPEPDLAFYLDVPPEVSLVRISSRDGVAAKYEEQQLEILAAVRQLFLSQPWQRRRLEAIDGTLEPDLLNHVIRARIEQHQSFKIACDQSSRQS